MAKQLLTAEILPSLVGKTINWSAPIYKGNQGHWGYGVAGGIATITEVNMEERRPIKATTVEGDALWFGFVEKPWTEDYVAYSDADRPISFEIAKPVYVINHPTKGYFQNLPQSIGWLTNVDNAFRYATRFYTVDQAEAVAKTLKSLDGKLLKKLNICILNASHKPFKFENSALVKTINNE